MSVSITLVPSHNPDLNTSIIDVGSACSMSITSSIRLNVLMAALTSCCVSRGDENIARCELSALPVNIIENNS